MDIVRNYFNKIQNQLQKIVRKSQQKKVIKKTNTYIVVVQDKERFQKSNCS